MHRIAFTLLLAAASASAQIPSAASPACPVNLFAERQSGVVLQRAGDAAKTDSPQSLHVTVHRTETPAIVSIEAILHGLSADPQVMPAAAHSASDLTRTFHLERKTGDKSLTSFDLHMSGAGVLRWVDVISITYADGTTWNSPHPSLCRATPSPLLLVADR